MKIQFSDEEKRCGQAVGTIIENAPMAVVKTGISVAGTVASLGWGLGKSLIGAGKVLVNGAIDGVASAQAKMQAAQLEKMQKELAKSRADKVEDAVIVEDGQAA